MFRIYTPFSRPENKERMIEHVKSFGVPWDVVIDKDYDFPDWVNVIKFPLHPDYKISLPSGILTYYYGSEHIKDDDYYVFLGDDDFLEPDFFKKLAHCTKDVICVSMKRGIGRGAYSGYGNDTLIAKPEETKLCHMGMEQIIIKGRLLKNYILKDDKCSDGYLIDDLYAKHRDQFEYVPDAYSWFNYLEPGRW